MVSQETGPPQTILGTPPSPSTRRAMDEQNPAAPTSLLPSRAVQGPPLRANAADGTHPSHPILGGTELSPPGGGSCKDEGWAGDFSNPVAASSHPPASACRTLPLGSQPPAPACSWAERWLFKLNYSKREAGGSRALPAAPRFQDFADFPKRRRAPDAEGLLVFNPRFPTGWSGTMGLSLAGRESGCPGEPAAPS